MVLSLILLILALIAWVSRATVIWTFVLAPAGYRRPERAGGGGRE
jgi:hypothetical protein